MNVDLSGHAAAEHHAMYIYFMPCPRRICANTPVLFGITLDPLQSQHPPHSLADLVFVVAAALTPHLGGLDVSGTLVVGLGEHAHDGDEDLLDGLDGRPALGGVLVVVRVVAGRVEDGDADQAAGIHLNDQLLGRGQHFADCSWL